MNEEEKEAIERLKSDINKPLTGGAITITNVEDLEILLNLINKLRKIELKSKKGIIKISLEGLLKLEENLQKKDKMIKEMIGYIATRSWAVCPNEECGANLDCENRCKADDNIYEECWRMYFERKIK